MNQIEKLFRFWLRITNYGIFHQSNFEERQERRITNSITLLTFIGHLGIIGTNLIAGLYAHMLTIILFTLSFLTLFPITAYFSVKFSKYHIVCATAILPLVIALQAPINVGVFLGTSYAQIYILVLIVVLFDFNKERIDFFILVTLSLLYSVFFDELLIRANGSNTSDIVFLFEQHVFYKAPLLGVWLLILLVFIYKQSTTNKNEKRIKYLHKQLIKEKKLVEHINNVLTFDNKEKSIKLAKQKVKIEKYSYRNDHEIKGPMARIQGLIYLLNNNHITEEEEVKQVLIMQKTAIDELYNCINSINAENEL